MSTQVRLRGGTTSQHNTFTGAEREVTVDTTKDTLVVHDGSTAGGIPLAKEADLSSVTTQLTAKADTAYVNTELATKADTTTVNTQLATKADTTTVSAKADTTYVNNELADKAELAGSSSQNFAALTLQATTISASSLVQAPSVNSTTCNTSTVDLGDWEIHVSGGNLKFRYQGTDRFKLSSTGALTVEDNITAYGNA